MRAATAPIDGVRGLAVYLPAGTIETRTGSALGATGIHPEGPDKASIRGFVVVSMPLMTNLRTARQAVSSFADSSGNLDGRIAAMFATHVGPPLLPGHPH
jgi:hypothetical protein